MGRMGDSARFLKAMGRLALTGLLVSCGGGGGGGGSSSNNNDNGITATGPGVLSVSPLDPSTLVYVTPLGNLAPPGHVLPTDHIYLHFVDPWGNQGNLNCSQRPVYAAGAGTVYFVLQTESQGDTKFMVQMTKTFFYYYDHVLLAAGIQTGSKVTAGQQIGTTTGRCPSIDLGVIDLDQTPPGFVNPARYGDHGAHAAQPIKYFSDSLRTLYYSRVRVAEGVPRAPASLDGRIDWGVRGRLAGDWFHASLANAPSSTIAGPEGWPKSLSFAYDWYDNAARISVGGTITTAGVLALQDASAPDPKTVSTANGVVAYQGKPVLGLIAPGWMLVQMLSDERIKVEYFANAAQKPAAFTAAAQEYVR